MTASRRLLLRAAETDTLAERVEGGWITRCIHCRSRIRVEDSSGRKSAGTVEHIVPKSWFGNAVASSLAGGLEGPDDPRNLAIACGRCNHAKGKGPDANGPGDSRAYDVVRRLLAARLERYRPPSGE
jgi:5-methylcytosine-specific restriction endonuclease McrA